MYVSFLHALPLEPSHLTADTCRTLSILFPDAWSSREGDVGGAAVITWTLWAIFSHQTKSSFIHWSALAFAILASLNVIKAFVTTWRGGGAMAVLHDEERAPLVGN